MINWWSHDFLPQWDTLRDYKLMYIMGIDFTLYEDSYFNGDVIKWVQTQGIMLGLSELEFSILLYTFAKRILFVYSFNK